MPERHTSGQKLAVCVAPCFCGLLSPSPHLLIGRCLVLFGSGDAGAFFFSGKSCVAMEGSVTSSNLTSLSLLTSPDPDENVEHNMW